MGIDKPTDPEEVAHREGGVEKNTRSLTPPEGYNPSEVYGKYPQYRVQLNPSPPTRADAPDSELFFSTKREAESAFELQRGKTAGYVVIKEFTEHRSTTLKAERLT